MQDAFKGYIRADVVQDMFEMLRLEYRDENNDRFRAWERLERAFVDALTLKQYEAIPVRLGYVERYKYATKISKSQKLLRLASHAEQAFKAYQASKAKYRAHLELDPEAKGDAK